MSPPVFLVGQVPAMGGVAVLDGPEGRHAATVRRIGVGERLLLTDGAGEVAECTVTAVAKDRLRLDVRERWRVPAAAPQVTVVQALPKSERSELAVELATEAGVDVVVPWQASRCVARWAGPKAEKGVARWRGTAREAAKQSRRAHVPRVLELHSTAKVGELVRACVQSGGTALVLHESATGPLVDVALTGDVLLVVGPEGGLADTEVAALTGAGARAVHLGPTVLRTSTAAAVALGALGVLTGRWDSAPPV